MKNQLTREYFHVPLYAWIAGVGALGLALLYFLRQRTTSSTAGGASAALTPYPTTNAGMNIPPITAINITNQLPPYPAVPTTQPGNVGWLPGKIAPQPVITSVGTGAGGIRPIPPVFSGVRSFFSGKSGPPPVVSAPSLTAPALGITPGSSPMNFGAAFQPSRTPISTSNLPQNAYPAPVGR